MSKTPNIFVRSLRELKSTRCLAVTALLIAINVTLDLLGLSIKLPPNLRIGFGFLCNASIGMLFGPVVGMMAGVCTDVLGYFAGNLSMGAYFPGYTLTAVVGGLIWGCGCIRARSPYGVPSAQRPASTCSAISA
ncbi:MAG: folate family ECF transporter S component [Eubacteriales bacterium]